MAKTIGMAKPIRTINNSKGLIICCSFSPYLHVLVYQYTQQLFSLNHRVTIFVLLHFSPQKMDFLGQLAYIHADQFLLPICM